MNKIDEIRHCTELSFWILKNRIEGFLLWLPTKTANRNTLKIKVKLKTEQDKMDMHPSKV